MSLIYADSTVSSGFKTAVDILTETKHDVPTKLISDPPINQDVRIMTRKDEGNGRGEEEEEAFTVKQRVKESHIWLYCLRNVKHMTNLWEKEFLERFRKERSAQHPLRRAPNSCVRHRLETVNHIPSVL